jgi:hypothetical protein
MLLQLTEHTNKSALFTHPSTSKCSSTSAWARLDRLLCVTLQPTNRLVPSSSLLLLRLLLPFRCQQPAEFACNASCVAHKSDSDTIRRNSCIILLQITLSLSLSLSLSFYRFSLALIRQIIEHTHHSFLMENCITSHNRFLTTQTLRSQLIDSIRPSTLTLVITSGCLCAFFLFMLALDKRTRKRIDA